MSIKKLASILATALESNFVGLRRPYKLNFCVTYRCQSRCLSCNIWQMKPQGELSMDEIRRFAGKNSYFKWIELTGGEVFLRDDIIEIAKAFSDSCRDLYILTMPTNSLCNPNMVRQRLEGILALGIPKVVITVSLDGYRELHDRLRGIPGNYDKAIQMFRMLQGMRKAHGNLEFVFGYTMSKLNQGKFADTFNAVKADIPDITHNDFHVNLAQTSDNYYNNSETDLRVDHEVAAGEIESLIRGRRFRMGAINAIETAFLKNLAKYAATGKTPMRSRSLEVSLFMDSFGDVYPSIMWNEKLGSIRDTDYSLEPIWNGEKAVELRKNRSGKEPEQWTSCEAYQSIIGNAKSLLTA